MAMITVTAPPGLRVPVPASIAAAPEGGLIFLEQGDELEVDDRDLHVVRFRDAGDFVVVASPRLRAPGQRLLRRGDRSPLPVPASPIPSKE